MNTAEELIYQYETQRGAITRLNKERHALISECGNISAGTGPYGLTEGVLCLSDCWAKPSFDDEYGNTTYDFEVTLQEHGCEACKKSFAIKRGPLMDAKKELGNIKRRLAVFGKKLIKEKG